MTNCKKLAALEQAEHNRYREHKEMTQLSYHSEYWAVTLDALIMAQWNVQTHLKECEICVQNE